MRILFATALLAVGLLSGPAYAQMAAAKRVAWDIDYKLEVPVERDSAWTLLKDYSLATKLSNGHILSVVNKDDIMPILREVTFKDGTKREELLSQVEEQHRFLVFDVKASSLPSGIKEASCAIFLKEKDDDSVVINWMVIVKGDQEAKKLYLPQWQKEVEHYAEGYRLYLKGKPKSVPAMRM